MMGNSSGAAVVIRSPEELVASVPGLLGFVPENGSVVVLCDGAEGRGPVLRLDVPELTTDEWLPRPGPAPDGVRRFTATDFLAGYCDREAIERAYVVLVFDGIGRPGDSELASEFMDAVEYWMSGAGTLVAGLYGVEEFGEGLRWTDYFSALPWEGEQHDPSATRIAAMRSVSGSAAMATRAEIDELYRRRDDADGTGASGRRPGYRNVSRKQARREYQRHCRLVRRIDSGSEPTAEDLRRVGRGLRVKLVRDQLLHDLTERGLEEVDGRRDLWWQIVRRRPSAERAEALVLLGAAAYFEGSGVHARAAFEEALASNPDCALAELILRVLSIGIAPDDFRRNMGGPVL